MLPEEVFDQYLYEVIEFLSKKDREEFVEKFSDDLKAVVSRAALSKLRSGIIHVSNETILEVCIANPAAVRWVLKKAREDALRVLEITKILEAELDSVKSQRSPSTVVVADE
jgi:hypothetical protein